MANHSSSIIQPEAQKRQIKGPGEEYRHDKSPPCLNPLSVSLNIVHGQRVVQLKILRPLSIADSPPEKHNSLSTC